MTEGGLPAYRRLRGTLHKYLIAGAKNIIRNEQDRLTWGLYSFEAEGDPISLQQIQCPICNGRALLEKFYQREMVPEFYQEIAAGRRPYNAGWGFERTSIVTQIRCREWRKNCRFKQRTEEGLWDQDTEKDTKKAGENTELDAPTAGGGICSIL